MFNWNDFFKNFRVSQNTKIFIESQCTWNKSLIRPVIGTPQYFLIQLCKLLLFFYFFDVRIIAFSFEGAP